MSNTFKNVKIDESDSRYKKLKDTFTEEIKKRFTCEDYDPIVNFVFTFVFESKNTKEDSIREMKELFYDKSEEIIELLWSLTEKIYGTNATPVIPNLNIPSSGSNNDLLDEIYKEKNDNQKKFPSQIVNPNVSNVNANVDQSKSGKPLFNSAIERVKEDTRRKDRYDRHERSDRNKGRDYEYRRYDDYSSDRRDRRRRDDNNTRTMQVGDKKIVLKRRDRSRSRSRSNSLERSRDEKAFEEENYVERERPHSREQHQPYDNRSYYPNERSYYPKERGYYPVRRFARGGGRFGRYMAAPRFFDPRRPMIRKRLAPRIPQEGEQQQQQQQEMNVNNIQENAENPVKMEGETTAPEMRVETQPEVERNPENRKKIRCKKWPMCKSEACEFSHPKETCPYFPKCMFGEKCLFIHPNIPCKFGYYCTRLGCAYSHPVGYNPGVRMMPSMPMSWGGPNKFKNLKMDHSKKPFIKAPQEVVEQAEIQQVPQVNPEQNQ